MRKLMWFTIGFAVAAAMGSYALAVKWYLLAAAVCAVLLGIGFAVMLRFPKIRVFCMLCVGCIMGFCFQTGFDLLYLSTARAADARMLDVTISASDYSYTTDYGSAVMGKVELNGKRYKVLTYLPENTYLAPGEQVTGTFVLRSTLPGTSRDSRINRGDGVFLKAYPKGELTKLTPEKMPIRGYPAYIRHYITDMIGYLFPDDTQAFATALLLGDTQELSYETDTALKVSGIRHVVAVSGLHVSILFSFVYAVTGRRRWLTALLGLPLLFLFAAVAGFSPSIVRACAMHALMVLGLLFDREYDPPTALSFAVLVLLLANPWTFTDVGFQLSVGCMVGIMLFSEPIKTWLLDKKRLGRFRGKWKEMLCSGVAVSVSAGIVTAPLCAYYFGMVSLISIVTNLLTLWVISYIFYGIMLSCAVALLHAPAGCAVAWCVAWPIRYVLKTAKILAGIPLSAVYTDSIYIVMWLVLCYVLLALFVFMKHKRPMLFFCCTVITLCCAQLACWLEPRSDECRVTVLDVGQGQCILLQSEGKTFMVDCGGSDDQTAADCAAAMLFSQGISRLDGLIITHYDADHAAGAPLLLSRIDADCLYLPNCVDADGTSALLYAYDGAICTVLEDTMLTFGNSKITLVPAQAGLSSNESGLCILFQTENCDILITGDRTSDGERELLAHMQLPELELLIVGHHGSKYSTSTQLLDATTPEYAIISVGYNRYGHPTQEVLDRLGEYGCKVYRTDENGTVIFRR